MSSNKKYDKRFKEEAVRLALTSTQIIYRLNYPHEFHHTLASSDSMIDGKLP